MTRPVFRRWMLIAFVIGLAARIAYTLAVYTPDLAAFESGDYALYRIGADHLLTQGNLVKSAGMDTRERSMLEPMLALLCALAIATAWNRVRRSIA